MPYSGRLESTVLPMLLSWVLPVLFFFGVWMFLRGAWRAEPAGPAAG